ncbi:MAG: hypothetical protein MUF54_06650 [Polyangiaceae bacterium]|jgi:hypothetical protein|nr:hypothetical protein [Polyangiaceae bacterium]
MAIDQAVHERIRAALEAFAGRTWRWGQGVIREIEIDTVNTTPVRRARLDTLTESRLERRLTRAAPEGAQPTPAGPARASIWNLPVSVPQTLEDAATAMVIPGTEHITTCDLCAGEQTMACLACAETGRLRGRRRCKQCDGLGRVRCDACEGSGRIVDWSCVEVLWEHDARYVAEAQWNLDDSTWLSAAGQELWHREATQLAPEAVASAMAGDDASFTHRVLSMIESVAPASEARVARQRLAIHRIDVCEVRYAWRGYPGRCVVVGDGGLVQGENLPLRRSYASRMMCETLDVLESWAQYNQRPQGASHHRSRS